MQTPRSIGEWTVHRRLGSGGMGVVFEVSRNDEARCALKLMNIVDEESKSRFDREFRALQRIAHDNVVQVYETGEYKGRPYFTMQLIEGVPLDVFVGAAAGGADVATQEVPAEVQEWSLIQDRPDDIGVWGEDAEPEKVDPLSEGDQALINAPERLKRVQDVVIQILRALTHIHDQRIIHRDLKPANVMVTQAGKVLLMDFGIAVDSDEDHVVVDTGQLVGTFAYMSPEQLRAVDVDLRSDLYALGVMLFELLSGRRPFEADSPAAAIYQHVFQPPPDLAVLNPGAPAELVSLAMRLLRKPRGERPPSARDVLNRFGEEDESKRSITLFKPDLVGRKGELKSLASEIDQVSQRQFRPANLLVGPAGVGKTRLLEELWDRARGQGFRIIRLSAPEPLEAPYSYFNPLLELILEIARDQPLLGRRLLRDDASVLARIAPRLTELDALEITQAQALAPSEERRRAKQVLWRVIYRLSRQEPLMLICDHLEKSDLLSLDALNHLCDQLARASAGESDELSAGSLSVVGAWREGDRSELLVEQQSIQRVTLSPLANDDLRSLVASCLGSAPGNELLDFLRRCSQGVPMVCIEALRTLAERDAIERRGLAPWELRSDVDVDALFAAETTGGPLDALVEQLFDSLSVEAGQILGVAAIYRSGFRLSHLGPLLEAVGYVFPEGEQLDALDHLVRHSLFIEGNRQRGFYHVAYGELARFARMRLSVDQYQAGHRHLAVAAALADKLDVDELLFHSVRGHQDDLTLEFLPDQALRFSELGDANAALSAYEGWIEVYKRSGEPYPVEAASGYTVVLRNLGRSDDAERVVVDALKRDGLTLEQDSELQMRYMDLLGDRGEGEEALKRSELLGRRLERIGAPLAARVQQGRAHILQRFGDPALARETAHDTVRRMDEMEVERGRAKALQLVALSEERVGNIRGAQQFFSDAIQAAREVGDDLNLMVALVNVTSARVRAGDLEGAEQAALEAQDMAQRLNVSRAEVIARANLEWIALERGATPALASRLQRMLQLVAESGNAFAEPEVRFHRGRCLMELGRRDEALADAEVGVELAKRSFLWREQMLCEALVARLIGDLDAFGPLLAEMDRVKATDEALIVREFYGQALSEADDEAAARTVWLDALETAVDRGYGTAARRLRVLLNEVENG